MYMYVIQCSICKWHWRMQALHYVPVMSRCERRLSFVLLMTLLSMSDPLRNLEPVSKHLRNLNY